MKYRTSWNLGLLYKNDKDPQIEKDIVSFEKACAIFEKKYKGKNITTTSKKLAQVLKEYFILSNESNLKPWWYFALRNEKNSDDVIATARATQIQDRLTQASNRIIFFLLEVGKIKPPVQKKLLKDPILHSYKYFLQQIFAQAKYNLSEKEEQLAGLLSQTSYTMWIDGQQRAVNQKHLLFKGEQIPLSKAGEILSQLPKPERDELHNAIIAVYKESSTFAEAEINAIVSYKKIMDERRGYKKSYSERLLNDEVDEKTIEDLSDIVSKYFKISKKFYALHSKLLGQKTVTRADRMVPIGTVNKDFTFDETVTIVKNAFSRVDKKYATIVQSFVDNGQVDVYPEKTKRSGAFCWGIGSLPVFVLLNHIDKLRSVETFAHEMGHAIHNSLDKILPVHYWGHSTATAEVASTFFEQLIIDEISKTLSQDEQLILLHGKCLENMITIFAQIAGFNYEIELHNEIRSKGQLSRGAIAKLLKKHYESFSGNAMIITEDDGYGFVGWWHTRMFFYVYSYAYGQLVSRALYEKWKADPSYAKQIDQFLSSGKSKSPKEIFASIGIKTDKIFFEKGLKAIEDDVFKLEKLAKKLKKI